MTSITLCLYQADICKTVILLNILCMLLTCLECLRVMRHDDFSHIIVYILDFIYLYFEIIIFCPTSKYTITKPFFLKITNDIYTAYQRASLTTQICTENEIQSFQLNSQNQRINSKGVLCIFLAHSVYALVWESMERGTSCRCVGCHSVHK